MTNAAEMCRITEKNINEIFAISILQEFAGIDNSRLQIVHFRGNEFLYIKRLTFTENDRSNSGRV